MQRLSNLLFKPQTEPKKQLQQTRPAPTNPHEGHPLTFVVDSAVLVGVGQLQHLVQLVLCHVLADHVHGRFELVARDVPVAVAVKYPKVRI